MRKHRLATAALFASAALCASAAHASPLIQIGLQESGVNGDAIHTVANGSGAASYVGNYGSFSVNEITALGSPGLAPPNLDSGAIDLSNFSGGTIDVYVTETGLTAPLGTIDLTSAFTSNVFNGSAKSVVESTYISTSDVAYGGTLLATSTFSKIGTATFADLTPSLTSPYSETMEYVITTGFGNADVNDTIDIASVPEPASIALLGSGLLALGLLLRRRSA